MYPGRCESHPRTRHGRFEPEADSRHRRARTLAVVLALVMVWYFATADALRADNPFLLPDLAFTALLLAAAVTPGRSAPPALFFAFGCMNGVLLASLFHYVVEDDFADGADHLAMMLPAAALSVWLGLGMRPATADQERTPA